MKTIQDYKIVSDTNVRSLGRKINGELHSGWLCQGIPFRFRKAQKYFYAQEMVRPVILRELYASHKTAIGSGRALKILQVPPGRRVVYSAPFHFDQKSIAA